MEFNGINNETNEINGFERRLSERASAIDELMELVKSIGGPFNIHQFHKGRQLFVFL